VLRKKKTINAPNPRFMHLRTMHCSRWTK